MTIGGCAERVHPYKGLIQLNTIKRQEQTMTREDGKKLIALRVEDFERNKVVLTKKGHGETNIRSNYIDKLFEALGWDMTNVYEVVREYSQRDRSTAAGMKKVDYALKLNGKLKLFIEAKEASVNLETDKDAIYQAKRYAYSSNGRAPIVILTDFEEFRVFNVIKAPAYDVTDKELLKSHCMQYTDYLEKWDILWDTFSREAVEGGSLDRLRGKIDKNTKTMDADFLEAITKWRETLARNIANRNENLNVQEINEAVQRILDRLIFIRNLEDREIEPENILLDARKKDDIYRTALLPLFRSLDKTYNGLLFKRHFSEDIIIDDKTLKEIIRDMCYPVSPFQFDIIEPEILGRVYEKFLGSKIILSETHRATIKEKPEVRHAGGVYYTPEYIVEYIVNNTVGKKIEGRTPDEIKAIKILDPACGSGSFLLGAYSCLLEYHRTWYAEHQQDKSYKNDWYLTSDGELKVRLDKRGDILRNNIFGVDIDHEATEVSIMSLYLKMLDDGFDKGQQDLFFAKGSILPDMSENIKCGNSLVGEEFFQENATDDILISKIKPFCWKTSFPVVFETNYGFDVIIGNPPYIRVQELEYTFIDYCKKNYETAWKRIDISILFIEKANVLLNITGLIGFITSNQFLATEYGRKCRGFLLSKCNIEKIVDYGDLPVFQGALTYVSVFILRKGKTTSFDYYRINRAIKIIQNAPKIKIDAASLGEDVWVLQDESTRKLLKKLNKLKKLSSVAKSCYGIITGSDQVFIFTEKEIKDHDLEPGIFLPLIRAQDCERNAYLNTDKYVLYPYVEFEGDTVLLSEKELSSTYPKTYQYLKINKKLLSARKDSRNLFTEKNCWYSLVRHGQYKNFKQKKIVTPGEVKRNKFCIDVSGAGFSGARVFGIILSDSSRIDIETLMVVLNSRLVEFWLHMFAPLKQGGYYSYSSSFLDSIPLPDIIEGTNKDENIELNKLSNIIIANNKKIRQNKINSSQAETQLMSAAFIEKRINELVYQLYDLTPDEIKIIEESTAKT